MKLLWTILIGLGAAILSVVVLNATGVVTIHWQQIATGLGVIAGPFKYLFSLFQSTGDKVNAIRHQHRQQRSREAQFQEKLAEAIKEDQQQVSQLQDKVNTLKSEMDTIQQRAKGLEEQVKQLKITEKKAKARELFGKF